MPIEISINTAQEVDRNGEITKPSRVLAKLELFLPPDRVLDQNTVLNIREQVLEIAVNHALGPGEVTQ